MKMPLFICILAILAYAQKNDSLIGVDTSCKASNLISLPKTGFLRRYMVNDSIVSVSRLKELIQSYPESRSYYNSYVVLNFSGLTFMIAGIGCEGIFLADKEPFGSPLFLIGASGVCIGEILNLIGRSDWQTAIVKYNEEACLNYHL